MNQGLGRLLRRLALLLVALLAWGFRPLPRLVDVEPAGRGHLAIAFEAEGRTRVKDSYLISAPIAALLNRAWRGMRRF